MAPCPSRIIGVTCTLPRRRVRSSSASILGSAPATFGQRYTHAPCARHSVAIGDKCNSVHPMTGTPAPFAAPSSAGNHDGGVLRPQSTAIQRGRSARITRSGCAGERIVVTTGSELSGPTRCNWLSPRPNSCVNIPLSAVCPTRTDANSSRIAAFVPTYKIRPRPDAPPMRDTESHTIPAASASGTRRSFESGHTNNKDDRAAIHSQISRIEKSSTISQLPAAELA